MGHMMEEKHPAMPAGKLILRLHSGKGFPSHSMKQWTCRMSVPIALQGQCILTHDLVSIGYAPDGGRGAPLFNQAREFSIDWSNKAEESSAAANASTMGGWLSSLIHPKSSSSSILGRGAPSPRDDEEFEFRRRVLALLED